MSPNFRTIRAPAHLCIDPHTLIFEYTDCIVVAATGLPTVSNYTLISSLQVGLLVLYNSKVIIFEAGKTLIENCLWVSCLQEFGLLSNFKSYLEFFNLSKVLSSLFRLFPNRILPFCEPKFRLLTEKTNLYLIRNLFFQKNGPPKLILLWNHLLFSIAIKI